MVFTADGWCVDYSKYGDSISGPSAAMSTEATRTIAAVKYNIINTPIAVSGSKVMSNCLAICFLVIGSMNTPAINRMIPLAIEWIARIPIAFIRMMRLPKYSPIRFKSSLFIAGCLSFSF